jgi:2-hydroxy-6-oxonona-2,4-dienedioate hydrolase
VRCNAPQYDPRLGPRRDSAVGEHLRLVVLEPLRLPTLIISVRDDGCGTHASAEYTASQIAGAKFICFESGGHVRVRHDDEVMAIVVKLIVPEPRTITP